MADIAKTYKRRGHSKWSKYLIFYKVSNQQSKSIDSLRNKYIEYYKNKIKNREYLDNNNLLLIHDLDTKQLNYELHTDSSKILL
jgi:hypothetical protein